MLMLYLGTLLLLGTLVQKQSKQYTTLQIQRHIVNMVETVEPFDIVEATEFPGLLFAQLELRELRRIQRHGPLIRFWINAVKARNTKFQKAKITRTCEGISTI